MDKLRFCSFNVNGLQGNDKRRKIFGIIQDQNIDVSFIQESHSTVETQHLWHNEHGGNIFYSHGTSESKGVMIIFRRALVYQIKNIKHDEEGRFLLIEVAIEGMLYLLCNAYCPNEDRPDFFYKVS